MFLVDLLYNSMIYQMEPNKNEFIVRRLNRKDSSIAQQLFLVLQEVFAIKSSSIASNEQVNTLLKNASFICFAAIYKDEVVGGLTAYELSMYHSAYSELFIYDIAVKPEFQRMGLGKKLIIAAKDYCKENKIAQLFVDASENDNHALDFYRTMNMREEKVIQFTFDQ